MRALLLACVSLSAAWAKGGHCGGGGRAASSHFGGGRGGRTRTDNTPVATPTELPRAMLPDNLMRIWVNPSRALVEQRRLIIAIWYAGDDEIRNLVSKFVCEHYPLDSDRAFTYEEMGPFKAANRAVTGLYGRCAPEPSPEPLSVTAAAGVLDH
jgi:hypothetical protein